MTDDFLLFSLLVTSLIKEGLRVKINVYLSPPDTAYSKYESFNFYVVKVASKNSIKIILAYSVFFSC